MKENRGLLDHYNKEEIIKLLNSKERLVYIGDGIEEFVARYEDLPDIIVDVNEKLGHTENLKVFDYKNMDVDHPLLTTIGYFLDKCNPDVRKDIFDRLYGLQMGELEIKNYKIINEDMLDQIKYEMEQEEMER